MNCFLFGPSGNNYISMRYRAANIRVPVNDVIYLHAYQRSVTVCFTQSGRVCYSELDDALAMLEPHLPERFMRIHRSAVVNRDFIAGIAPLDLEGVRSSKHQLKFTVEVQQGFPSLPIARNSLPVVRRYLKRRDIAKRGLKL